MDIANENPSVDPIEYITKQLPKDLVQLLQVRDELAVRQGALSAVEDAVADRAKAKAEMEAAQAEALAVRADAKQFLVDAKAKADQVTAGANAKAIEKQADAQFKDAGWRIRDPSEAAPRIRHTVDRLGIYLTLVGLSALLIGGVGVANAINLDNPATLNMEKLYKIKSLLDEMKAFVDAAHARGIKVYLDIITNHTADVITYRECPRIGCPYRSKAD